MLDVLDAAAVLRWSHSAVQRLEAHRAEIDALNVFPVPDSDTGRNMLLTLRSADQVLADTRGAEPRLAAGAALAAMSAGAARGAIGNSGFLLSQILRGLAESAGRAGQCDAAALAAGLGTGARLARAAVVTPVEGTILTVARAAADAASHAPDGTLRAVLRAAVSAADAALQHTPEQLPELAEAGVVDAGGRGLVLVLDALAAAVTGSGADLTPVRLPEPEGARRPEVAHPGFEVQYLLDAPQRAVDRLRSVLDGLGESVAVVGAGRDAWKVHAHVADVGAAIEAGLEAGRPHQISVVQLDAPATVEPPRVGGRRGLLAVVPGDHLAQLFKREGVRVVPGTASGDDFAAAVPEDTRELVILVPAEAAAAADHAAARLRRRDVQVSVVPVRSPVQSLAAVAVHDPARRFEDDVVAMAEAAAATRFAEVTIAETAGLTAVGLCQPGDVLGLIDGEVVEVGHSVLTVAFDLIDRLLGIGAELVTMLTGAGLPDHAGELLESHVRTRSPLTDVAVYAGGQPDHPVIIGAE